jgi:hypothetical protein
VSTGFLFCGTPKTVLPAEQVWPGVARRRRRWIHYRDRFDPRRIVFIDETWIKINMAAGVRGARG